MDLRIVYLLDSNEPWTRYCTLVDILDFPEGDPEVESARQEMMAHPQIQELIGKAGTWPGYPLKRHNDARHPLYAISTLADFGLQADDPGIEDIISRVMKHTSSEGMLETQVLIPRAFGGTDKEDWTWLLCDSPTLLYSLLTFQGADQANLAPAVNYLSELVYENGWHCTASPDLGKFKGPGRREEPCPIANIYALKSLGVRTVISVSAVGSLREQIEPRHFVVPDQLIDRTRGTRRSTFCGDGVVVHTGFGDPFCPVLRDVLVESARDAGTVVHPGGTLVVMEGPAFSTRAESFLYRSWGASIIGMTALPEAKLAREAGLCYAILAMSTDYDVWHETEEDVTIETVIANVQANAENARKILGLALGRLESTDLSGCDCCAGSDTVMTSPQRRNPRKMEDISLILER